MRNIRNSHEFFSTLLNNIYICIKHIPRYNLQLYLGLCFWYISCTICRYLGFSSRICNQYIHIYHTNYAATNVGVIECCFWIVVSNHRLSFKIVIASHICWPIIPKPMDLITFCKLSRGLVTHITSVNWINIDSGISLSSVRDQAIIKINANLLSIGPIYLPWNLDRNANFGGMEPLLLTQININPSIDK